MDPLSTDRLTIVIPTFRRPAKAKRALEFWAGRGFKVLMLDGSETALDLPAAAKADANLTYLHMPQPLSTRLGHAARIITTDYATLCGDDDFVLPSALLDAVAFLDRNPDYASCGGQGLGFGQGLFGKPSAFVRYETFRGFDLAKAAPRDRVLTYFSALTPASVYAVCRSPLFGAGMSLWADKEFPVYAIGEIQFEFLMAYCGKIRRLPVLHWLRSHEKAHGTHARIKGKDVSLSKAVLVPDVWQRAEHAALKSEIIAYTAAKVAAISGQPVAQVSADFDQAVTAYVDFIQRRQGKPGLGLAQRLRQKLTKRMNRLRLPFPLRLSLLRRQGITVNAADVDAVIGIIRASR